MQPAVYGTFARNSGGCAPIYGRRRGCQGQRPLDAANEHSGLLQHGFAKLRSMLQLLFKVGGLSVATVASGVTQ